MCFWLGWWQDPSTIVQRPTKTMCLCRQNSIDISIKALSYGIKIKKIHFVPKKGKIWKKLLKIVTLHIITYFFALKKCPKNSIYISTITYTLKLITIFNMFSFSLLPKPNAHIIFLMCTYHANIYFFYTCIQRCSKNCPTNWLL